ncbi:hypothetical protein GCM10027418_23820 [Mariniluteicoccus endophyticus]
MAKPTRLAKGIAKQINPKLKYNKKGVREFEVDSYRGLNNRARPHDKMQHDHIPSAAALKKAEEDRLGRKLTKAEARRIEQEGTTIAVRDADHAKSRTYKNKNTPEQIANDAKDLNAAQERDLAQMRQTMRENGHSEERINATLEKIRERNRKQGI